MKRERRIYGQRCAIARGLDLVGERWTLLIVRELMTGPRRFKDLVEGLHGIASNLLAARLKEMEEIGIIGRRILPPPAGVSVYELTELGKGLEPVVLAIGLWGHQFLGPRQPGEVIRPAWFVVSLRASFHPEAARGLSLHYELDMDGELFHLDIADGVLQVGPGAIRDPDIRLVTDVLTLARLLSGEVPPEEVLASGKVAPGTKLTDLRRFVELFKRPPRRATALAGAEPAKAAPAKARKRQPA